MTEAEWLAATNPEPMLEFLRGKASDRKLRLFCVVCCRRVWPSLTDERSRRGVDLAEQWADGEIGSAEFAKAGIAAWRAYHDASDESRRSARAARLTAQRELPPYHVSLLTTPQEGDPTRRNLRVRQLGERAADLRDILGNPFRPVAFDPAWRTSTVLALAEGIYAERAFDRLPILADALMDAGCDADDILAHCRGDGPHVRGCWVVDLVLGKE